MFITQKGFPRPLCNMPLPTPLIKETRSLFTIIVDSLACSRILYKHNIFDSVSLLKVTSLRIIIVVAYINSPFLFISGLYSIAQICHNLFIYSMVDRCLNCLQFGAISIEVAVFIYKPCVDRCVSFLE